MNNNNIEIKESGFTLLELMMSMVILAIAFLGILPLFFYSQALIKDATLQNMALSVLQNKMDRILELDYNRINYSDFDDSLFPDVPEYTFILPEVATDPCDSYAINPCGFVTSGASQFRNYLLDIVDVQGYFFTRVIDIDQPDISNSIETGDDPLPPGDQTLRVTISVYWTVPGNKEHFVSSTTEIHNDEDRDL